MDLKKLSPEELERLYYSSERIKNPGQDAATRTPASEEALIFMVPKGTETFAARGNKSRITEKDEFGVAEGADFSTMKLHFQKHYTNIGVAAVKMPK